MSPRKIEEGVLQEAHEADPSVGVAASIWRSWAEHASPELLAAFNGRALKCMKAAQVLHGPGLVPGSGPYRNMRRDVVNALNRLSEAIQGEHDHGEHQDLESDNEH